MSDPGKAALLPCAPWPPVELLSCRYLSSWRFGRAVERLHITHSRSAGTAIAEMPVQADDEKTALAGLLAALSPRKDAAAAGGYDCGVPCGPGRLGADAGPADSPAADRDLPGTAAAPSHPIAGGRASEAHSGNPSGRMTACTFPPWTWAFPEYHRSITSPFALTAGSRQRSDSMIVPSRMTCGRPSWLARSSASHSTRCFSRSSLSSLTLLVASESASSISNRGVARYGTERPGSTGY
jgi:hypothetical protein